MIYPRLIWEARKIAGALAEILKSSLGNRWLEDRKCARNAAGKKPDYYRPVRHPWTIDISGQEDTGKNRESINDHLEMQGLVRESRGQILSDQIELFEELTTCTDEGGQ